MSEILQSNQGVACPAQRDGQSYRGTAVNAENLIDQGDLEPAPDTARDGSTQNDSATARADTGKMRGICSPGVPPNPEIDRRLREALFQAGRSALGMPGTVDTLKEMLARAGLILVLA